MSKHLLFYILFVRFRCRAARLLAIGRFRVGVSNYPGLDGFTDNKAPSYPLYSAFLFPMYCTKTIYVTILFFNSILSSSSFLRFIISCCFHRRECPPIQDYQPTYSIPPPPKDYQSTRPIQVHSTNTSALLTIWKRITKGEVQFDGRD